MCMHIFKYNPIFSYAVSHPYGAFLNAPPLCPANQMSGRGTTGAFVQFTTTGVQASR